MVDTSHLDNATMHIVVGEKYRPAMDDSIVSTEEDAQTYFDALVRYHMRLSPKHDKERAWTIERGNLAYFAGYYDNETRQRVERLFKCVHPVFGKAIAEPVSATEAFEAGKRYV